MSRKQRGKGNGPGASGQPQPQAKPQGGAAGGGWGPLRDSVRREIEQAAVALAFAERLHTKLDTQRRLFVDFSRVMEQLRSGAFERVGGSLSRLFEGGQGFDLQRFLRDLPLALSQLAVAEAQARRTAVKDAGAARSAAAPATKATERDATVPAADAPSSDTTGVAVSPDAAAAPSEMPTAGTTPEPGASATAGSAAAEAGADAGLAKANAPAEAEAPLAPAESMSVESTRGHAESGPLSPRLELRSKLLAAAPQLAKAAAAYRRSVATVKRAAAPRRSPGPWRSDREVLEEARRAVEFARQLFDAYAEAWADQPLAGGSDDSMAAEMDRFLAWTQLDRYVELAVHGDPRHSASHPPPSGRRVVAQSQPPAVPLPATEASPVAAKDTAGVAGGPAGSNGQAEVPPAAEAPPADASSPEHEPPQG